MEAIVGRRDELESIESFLCAETAGAGALVIEGEPGIGKSILWDAGVERARARGQVVLRCRPAEAEQSLARAGLGDLLHGVAHDVVARLPVPQSAALSSALLLATPTGRIDRRALAVAVRGALELLTERGHVLVAIDDAQWLDRATADALAFAFRRLDGQVSFLVARRAGAASFELADAQLMTLGALSVGALHQLLSERLGHPLPRRRLLRIHERSGGNPFYAIELAASPAFAADSDPLEPLEVPETLDQLLRARLGGLPPETRSALELLSALGTAPIALLERADVSATALDPALESKVVELDDGTVRFTHPLIASVLYGDLGERSRNVHARLVELVDEPMERARHLALASAGVDEDVAREVEAAAVLAADRGASAVAAELAERAFRLTPEPAGHERTRRLLFAARMHQAAGDWVHARALVHRLFDLDQKRDMRAEAMVLLAELEPATRQISLLQDALEEASGHAGLQAEIHCRLAWADRFSQGTTHARAALAIAESLGDASLHERAAAVDAILGWFRGEGSRAPLPTLVTREFVSAVGGEQLVQEATQAVVNTYAPASMRAGVRRLLEAEHEEWRDRDEPRSGHALWGLAWVDFWAGDWESAVAHAVGARDIAVQYALERPQDHLPLAVIEVHRGRLEQARAHSERALELATQQFGFHPPQHQAVLGLAAVWGGEPAEGVRRLEQAERTAVELGWGEPSLRWWVGDLVESFLTAGRRDDAERMLARWEDQAQRVGRAWVVPHALRCRALIASIEGDHAAGEAALQQAIAQHEELGDPYGRARAELALGTVRRRARQKRSTREAIEAALAGFEALDALTWIDVARDALAGIGGRVRQDGLTSAERRVARLVAEGRSNREVAATLFLAERTVASHLTHIYAKLGVQTRTQLARKVQTF